MQKLLSENKPEFALSLKLYIVYKDTDNLGTAAALLLDLDSDKHHLAVLFEYSLTYGKYHKLMTDYAGYKAKGINRDFAYYISNNINKYFLQE